MITVINISIFLLLAVIIYQDFRYRAISWITLPLLFIAFAINYILATGINSFLHAFLLNNGFIVFQLIAVTAYFSFKNRSLINIASEYIGWGDILFFVVAAAVFSPVNFIVFYLLCIIVVLLVALAYRAFKKTSSFTIPLAGAMALILALFYFFAESFLSFDIRNDEIFLTAFMLS